MKNKTEEIIFNVYNNRPLINEIIQYLNQVGGYKISVNITANMQTDTSLDALRLVTSSKFQNLSWYGYYNESYPDVNNLQDFKNLMQENDSLKVGDKVDVTFSGVKRIGTIFAQVTDKQYIVHFDKSLTATYSGDTQTWINYCEVNVFYITKHTDKPQYIDEVCFDYPNTKSGDAEQRIVSVLTENADYITGHYKGTQDYRRFTKSKIMSTIYRKSK